MSGIDPFIVYVIVGKDTEGHPRGIEKSTGRIYFNEIDAQRDAWAYPNHMITECIIMDTNHYDDITRHYDPQS